MRLTKKELESPVRSKDASRVFPVKRPSNVLAKIKASRPQALIYCANGQTLSQRLVRPLPARGGQDVSTQDDSEGPHDEDEDEHPHHTSEFIPSQWSATPASSPSKAKATNQWQRWTYDVIPTLVPILMKLLYKTTSLRNTDGLELETRSTCTCRKQRHLNVAVIRMTGTSNSEVLLAIHIHSICSYREHSHLYMRLLYGPRDSFEGRTIPLFSSPSQSCRRRPSARLRHGPFREYATEQPGIL